MSTPSDEGRARLRIPFYDGVLRVAEIWFVVALLLLVVLATFVNILDRNLQLGLWEYAVVEKMVYSCVFYIGVFGAVIAARRAEHISIDAVTHFLPERARLGLAVAVQLVAAVACAVLTNACYEWIRDVLDPNRALLAARSEWWLSTRLWRWPIVVGLGLMSLHFFVNALRFGVAAVKYVPPAEPPPKDEPVDPGEGGSERGAEGRAGAEGEAP